MKKKRHTRAQVQRIIEAGPSGLAECSCGARLHPGGEYVAHRNHCDGTHTRHFVFRDGKIRTERGGRKR